MKTGILLLALQLDEENKQTGLRENLFVISEIPNFRVLIQASTFIIRYRNKSRHNFKSADHLAFTSTLTRTSCSLQLEVHPKK